MLQFFDKKKNNNKNSDSPFLSKAVCAECYCNTTPATNERKGGEGIQKEGVNPTRVSQFGEYVETPRNPVRFISELPATANHCEPLSWPGWKIMILAHRRSSDNLRATIQTMLRGK